MRYTVRNKFIRPPDMKKEKTTIKNITHFLKAVTVLFKTKNYIGIY